MMHYVADTHSLIWYLEDSPRLIITARECFDACDRGQAIISLPTICLVEIIYLQEKGRIPGERKAVLDGKPARSGGGIVLGDLSAEVVKALPHVPKSDVPDMPDRIMAATPLCLGMPLISRDRWIGASGVETIR
jgi:PIN domain nuclease of toxin-antitoxin system